MAISYPIAFPDNEFVSDFSYSLIHAVEVSESPFTFQQQTYENQGDIWQVDLSIEVFSRVDAEAYNTFLLKLNGRKGTFTMPIFGSETPLGSAGGTPLVKGASQTGHDLVVDGCPVSTTGWLKSGDWIQLGTRLHKVLNDVNTNSSGEATITVMPKIVVSPADNDPVVVSNAKGVFRLVKNENPINAKPDGKHRISFTAREAK